MAGINIQQELQRLYQQNQAQSSSLSERLNQMDQYASQVDPYFRSKILDSSNRPEGYNPVNDWAAAIDVGENSRSLRSATSQDLERTQGTGLQLLQELDQLAQRNAAQSPADKLMEALKLEAAKQSIKDGKLVFDPQTRELKASGKTVSDASSEIISVVDKLLAQDTKPITGAVQWGNIRGTKAKQKQALYDQLKGMLSFNNRAQLKGSGAISDFEFKVLGQAVSALNQDARDEDFRATLQELRTKLSGGDQSSAVIPKGKKNDPLGVL